MKRTAVFLLLILVGTPSSLIAVNAEDSDRHESAPVPEERIAETEIEEDAEARPGSLGLLTITAPLVTLAGFTMRFDCGSAAATLTEDCESRFCRPPPSVVCPLRVVQQQ
jgi:hypothetical protein